MVASAYRRVGGCAALRQAQAAILGGYFSCGGCAREPSSLRRCQPRRWLPPQAWIHLAGR